MKKIILVLLVVFMVIGVTISAAAQDVKIEAQKKQNAEYTIRLAYTDTGMWPEQGNKPLPEHAFALVFKSIVESKSNGDIYVELFPACSLGQSKEQLEMVKSGTLEMSIQTGALAGLYPPIQVISLPYAFRCDEVAWWFFDNSEYWENMKQEIAEKTNMIVLGMGQNGTRHFTNSKRPIHEPADMKGLKFRVMPSPIFVKLVESFGAKAIPLAHGEIYTSCQTHLVDGQENPVWNIVANKWYEVQKYMVLDGHAWSENMMVINKNYFEKLPEEFQQIIKIAAIHGQVADRASEELASRVTDYNVLNKHMEIYSPTPEDMKKFKEASKPVSTWLANEIGESYVNDFYKAVKEAEIALGYRN